MRRFGWLFELWRVMTFGCEDIWVAVLALAGEDIWVQVLALADEDIWV